MLGFLKKNKKDKNIVKMYAPIKGKVIKIEEIPDEVFSSKMVGDGFAVVPDEGLVCSPCEGEVLKIFPTKHAILMKTNDGLELIVHLGIDTVELKGEGFKELIEAGTKVKVGEPLVEMDLAFIEENGKSTISPCVITNMDKIEEITVDYKNCALKEEVCRLKLK